MKTPTKNREERKGWGKAVSGLLAISLCCMLVVATGPAALAAAATPAATGWVELDIIGSDTDTPAQAGGGELAAFGPGVGTCAQADGDGLPALDSGIDTSAQAEIKSKSEIIYALLDYDGMMDTSYVVNHFSVTSEGAFTDHGAYSTVQNLTNVESISMNGDEVTLAAAEGEFYYQGTMQTPQLPWQFSVGYTLDGKALAAYEVATLGGESGRLGIHITTAKTPGVDESFYQHYALQISLSLPTANTSNLSAEGATITSSGSDTQVSYTVLPASDADYSLAVDFDDINMPGITVAAVPFGMDFDLPDTSGISDELATLVSAINELSSGVSQIDSGAAQAATGLEALASGSDLYNSGILQLSEGSDEIRAGVEGLNGSLGQTIVGLETMASLITDPAKQAEYKYMLEALKTISDGYHQLGDGLDGYTQGVDALAAQYGDINSGVSQSAFGVRQLSNGTAELSSGAWQLMSGVEGMPEEMQDRIDEFAASYDFSGFEPRSYLSSKNGNVVLVQFVITTPAIELPDESEEVGETPSESTILDKVLDLFTSE